MLRFLVTYLIVFYSLTAIGALALKNYQKTHYSKSKLEDMITTPSRFRDTTTNPCQYAIHGDPAEAGSRFVKINFICDQNSKTVSTLSLQALPDNQLSTILSEYARILGFDPKIIANWPCFIENKPISNINQLVLDKSQILCHHPDVKINQIISSSN